MQSNNKELEQVIEAILYIAGQGVEVEEIAEKLEIKEKTVETAIENLKTKHAQNGINIITYKGKAQMCSNPKYSDDIAAVLNPIKEKQLTKAALETMAVIAYKQPITRTEIEQVRGVNCDYAVQILLDFKLIEVIGRKDAVGKPLLFGTTDEFLKRFQLQSVADLPDYEDLLERIRLIHADKTDALYNEFDIPDEEELPEHLLGEEELETITAD
ncbi:MAG: SMC-Scp complex subunit ScpB [Christensenellaceae bacterium]|jgi:segregation and condensation protein B|nr:SMC-Scp complex subunit ScpB [Christensenellaceae bacterium]